jgi:hypothetical protein
MKNLLSLEGLTAEVLAYKIFETSIHTKDVEMVRIMLEAGMDPSKPQLANLLPLYKTSDETLNKVFPALTIASPRHCSSLGNRSTLIRDARVGNQRSPDIVLGSVVKLRTESQLKWVVFSVFNRGRREWLSCRKKKPCPGIDA